MKLVEIKNISKKYHTPKNEILALKNISFDVGKGEFIAIVGPSGCGKSTILSILCDLENKSSGEIIKKDNLKFGFMFQQDTLFDWLTIIDNCLLGSKINNSLNEDTLNYCTKLLKSYGLYEFKDSYPKELSGGMRQRVALIRTLMTNPDMLLLDEPFGTYVLVLKTKRSTNMKCKYFTIRTKKGLKYYYCKLHKKEISVSCYQGCDNKEYKQYKTLSNKSKSLNKREKERFSIIYPNFKKCCVCLSKWQLTTHEIFGGRNRSNSMKYGLCLPLCLKCHQKYQEDKVFNDKWHSIGQTKFEKTYPDLDFIKIFRRNYK